MSDRTARRLVRLAARRRNAARPTFRGWVRLESSGWYIQVDDVLEDPLAGELIGEDAAWHFAVADWLRRRPGVLRREVRRAWLAEEQALATQAARLVDLATRLRTLRPLHDAAG